MTMPQKYSEKLFRHNFVLKFRELFPLDHIINIETEATTIGVPDINICKGGKEVWVELKAGRLTTKSIKPGQYVWHIKRNQAGGKTWLVQRNDDSTIDVYQGSRILEFKEKPNSVTPDKCFTMETRESWRELFIYLLSG